MKLRGAAPRSAGPFSATALILCNGGDVCNGQAVVQKMEVARTQVARDEESRSRKQRRQDMRP